MTASLLNLPLEIRQHIYSYLVPRESVSHPLPGVGVSSSSHRLPPSNMISVNAQITDEVLDYYYSLATFKLIFSHAFNFFRVDPDLKHLERSPSLKSIRKVEIVFFCDILLLKNYPSFGLAQFCAEIRRRAHRACEVLCRAKQLRSVTVSWIDTTLTGGWDVKAPILEPLRLLTEHPYQHVDFRVGEVSSAEDVDRMAFRNALLNVVGPTSRIVSGSDGCMEGAMKLSMLAFEPRQEMHPLPQGVRLGDVAGGLPGSKVALVARS